MNERLKELTNEQMNEQTNETAIVHLVKAMSCRAAGRVHFHEYVALFDEVRFHVLVVEGKQRRLKHVDAAHGTDEDVQRTIKPATCSWK